MKWQPTLLTTNYNCPAQLQLRRAEQSRAEQSRAEQSRAAQKMDGGGKHRIMKRSPRGGEEREVHVHHIVNSNSNCNCNRVFSIISMIPP